MYNSSYPSKWKCEHNQYFFKGRCFSSFEIRIQLISFYPNQLWTFWIRVLETNKISNRTDIKFNEWIKRIEPVQMRMSNDCWIEQFLFFQFSLIIIIKWIESIKGFNIDLIRVPMMSWKIDATQIKWNEKQNTCIRSMAISISIKVFSMTFVFRTLLFHWIYGSLFFIYFSFLLFLLGFRMLRDSISILAD